MKILFASSEVVPFAKTGGLADVAGALPIALPALGHDVRVVMPLYKTINAAQFGLRPILSEINVRFPSSTQRGYVQRSTFPNSSVPVYFIQHDAYFGRDQLYTQNGQDFPDNPERFAFFCLAALWMLKGLDWQPDVIHCNDWQTALIPTYLQHHPEISQDSFYPKIKTVYTIHNLAYQCLVSREWVTRLGLSESLFHPEGVEFYGKFNLMKAGILYSDHITTVSRQYAKEIRTPEYGYGLDGLLRVQSNLTGILNGIDYSIWNPEVDSLIPSKYSPSNLRGKEKCKAALQKRFDLQPKTNTPIIGMISRLADQKGFDLIAESIDDLMKLDVQLVILGAGDPKYHELLTQVSKRYPHRTGITLGFDNALAHCIEAGSDMFLMPSLYEPCGLNQLYSLKYGTIPIVRKTGGLSDSITNASPSTIQSGTGTGFVFEEYIGKRMLDAITRAIKLYKANPRAWAKLVQNAMSRDFSWDVSAREYQKLYRKVAD